MSRSKNSSTKFNALALSAILYSLAGCGGDEVGSGTTPPITISPTPAPTPTPPPPPVAPTPPSTGFSTAAVLCPFSGSYQGTYSTSGILTSTWSWACNAKARTLIANGLPNHAVGTFPNASNPNAISGQNVNFTATLTPSLGTTNRRIGGPGGVSAFSLQGVKFDPSTAGTCAGTITATSQCNLANGTGGTWAVEALGQDTFNFGEDSNNAHVQPSGEYHYHGMPEAVLANAGVTDSSRRMLLVGWAGDGFPIYARYCYSVADNANSALKVCSGSFVKDTVADAGRPSTSLVPLGAFTSDWTYSAGTRDLDECNGRTGATPEFPSGIYYYMATDTYPYFSRCVKGV